MRSDKKKWNKTEKDRNDMKKENNSSESDFKENEIPDLNSLKQKQTSETLTVVALIMRKKVLNIKWLLQVQCKSSRWQMFFKIDVRPATLLKK